MVKIRVLLKFEKEKRMKIMSALNKLHVIILLCLVRFTHSGILRKQWCLHLIK